MPLLLSLLHAVAFSAPTDCQAVGLTDLAAVPAPAILVLGETPGEPDDLRRAYKLVRALRGRDRVTVGLQAIHQDYQGALQGMVADAPDLGALDETVQWSAHWPWSSAGYRGVLTMGLTDVAGGVQLTALGGDEIPPRGAEVGSVPEGYAERLQSISDGTLTGSMAARVARARSWSDSRMAERALEAWGGEGYLVVIVDRTRVAGPGGVDWQLERRASQSVHAVVLDWSDADCMEGEKQWVTPRWTLAMPAFMTRLEDVFGSDQTSSSSARP